MPRALLLVLDSVGCGGAEDAARFGDAGADTLGHIAAARAKGGAPLHIPNLDALGLGLAAEASAGVLPPGLTRPKRPGALWGFGVERAPGKDTPSGHWEIAGAPCLEPWGYFPKTEPCFPPEL
ncbi:MAG: phosphopentomutase, partial [Methylocella sp.]